MSSFERGLFIWRVSPPDEKRFVGGLCVSIPLAAATGWTADPWAWAAALAAGAGSFAAQLSMTEAYGALSVPEASVWLQLSPLATYLLAVPLLGEPLTASGMLGVLVGACGIAYGTVLGHRSAARGPAA